MTTVAAGLVKEEGSGASGEAVDAETSPDVVDAEPSSDVVPTDAPAVAETLDVSIPPVQVCIRLRPLLSHEVAEGHDSTALELQDGTGGAVTLKAREGSEKVRSFRFNAVVGPGQSQRELWATARLDALVGKVISGFHATMFAYGQTGTGKTFTMEGFNYTSAQSTSSSSSSARPRARIRDTPEEQLGIVPRAVQALFSRMEELRAVAKGPHEGAFVRVSFLQIYNEHIYDLLNVGRPPGGANQQRVEDAAGLRLRWDAAKQNFFVRIFSSMSATRLTRSCNTTPLVCATSMSPPRP